MFPNAFINYIADADGWGHFEKIWGQAAIETLEALVHVDLLERCAHVAAGYWT